MSLTLVIMAAGLGSRYGGLKQIEPISKNGEIMMEYAIYDAKEAGFDKVVFVLKQDFVDSFKETIGKKIEKSLEVRYVIQDITFLPEGFVCPTDRVKPFGTAHAVLCCKDSVNEPFVVINADDYYGKNTFKMLADFLNKNEENYCMAGFLLKNTLTENGSVARGVCEVGASNELISVVERTKIEKHEQNAKYEENGHFFNLEANTLVSMNTWGFQPSIFDELSKQFREFLEKNITNNKAEFFLPTVVDNMIKENKVVVKVLKTEDKWYGVTYKEDRENVVNAISAMIDNGLYPEKLF